MFQNGWTQKSFDSFLKLSDSLNKKRQNSIFIIEAVLATGVLIGLNQLRYTYYAKSHFHFINDDGEFMQMDKIRHPNSSYHIGYFGTETLNSTVINKKNQLNYGASFEFAFHTSAEYMNGYSARWRDSSGVIIANAR